MSTPQPDPEKPTHFLVTDGIPVTAVRPGQRWRSCEMERRQGRARIETVARVLDAYGPSPKVSWEPREGGALFLRRVLLRSFHLDGQGRNQGWVCVQDAP